MLNTRIAIELDDMVHETTAEELAEYLYVNHEDYALDLMTRIQQEDVDHFYKDNEDQSYMNFDKTNRYR